MKFLLKLIESIKLRHRANKYKNKNDQGGIAYMIATLKQGQTSFDIGAHKAGYLYFMLQQVGIHGKIVAFEPQHTLYTYISKMKTLCGWHHVTVEYLALSNIIGEATLYIPNNQLRKGTSPGATIVARKYRTDIGKTEAVPTETLDTYCHFKKMKPDFLKIDVEGNELNVLQGGIEILKKYKPKILVEIETRHVGREKMIETFAFMADLGYTGYFINGINRMPLSDFSVELHQNTSNNDCYCNNFVFE